MQLKLLCCARGVWSVTNWYESVIYGIMHVARCCLKCGNHWSQNTIIIPTWEFQSSVTSNERAWVVPSSLSSYLSLTSFTPRLSVNKAAPKATKIKPMQKYTITMYISEKWGVNPQSYCLKTRIHHFPRGPYFALTSGSVFWSILITSFHN